MYRLDPAVVHAQVARLEQQRLHYSTPRIGFQHLRYCCISSGKPSASCSPNSITTTRISQTHDEIHVVFDQQDAHTLCAQLAPAGRPAPASRGGGSRRPVHPAAGQQGITAERPRDLPVRCCPRAGSRLDQTDAHPDDALELAPLPPAAVVLRRDPAARPPTARRAPQMRTDRDVFQHRHGRHSAGHAGRSGSSRAWRSRANSVRRCAGPGSESHPRSPVHTRDAIEQRALAGTVRPDQRHHFRSLDGEVHAVVGDQAAKTLGHLADQQHRALQRGYPDAAAARHGTRACALRHVTHQEWPDAIARAMQNQDQQSRTPQPRSCRWHRGTAAAVLQPLLEESDQPAPTTAPQTCAAPPSTAMKRYSMPCADRKASG